MTPTTPTTPGTSHDAHGHGKPVEPAVFGT